MQDFKLFIDFFFDDDLIEDDLKQFYGKNFEIDKEFLKDSKTYLIVKLLGYFKRQGIPLDDKIYDDGVSLLTLSSERKMTKDEIDSVLDYFYFEDVNTDTDMNDEIVQFDIFLDEDENFKKIEELLNLADEKIGNYIIALCHCSTVTVDVRGSNTFKIFDEYL